MKLCFRLLVGLAHISAISAALLRSSASALTRAANTTEDEVDHREIDALAKDDFVRKCTVALSVTDDKLHPTSVVEKFCQTTDAVVECRMELAMELKRIYQQGGEGSQIQDFCVLAYGWFEKKYGMYCPSQCSKYQCKATCLWLDAKKTLDKVGETLKEEEEASQKDRSSLEAAEKALKETEQESLDANRTVEQAEVDVKRANESYHEAIEAFEFEEKQVSKVDAEVERLKEKHTNLTKAYTEKEDFKTQLQFTIDKVNLNISQQKRVIEYFQENLTARKADITPKQGEIDKHKEELKKLMEDESEEQKKVEELDTEIEAAESKVEDKKSNLQKAEDILAKVKNNHMSDTVIGTAEDGVRQEEERLKKAEDELWELNRTRTSHKIDLAHTRKDISEVTNETEAANTYISGVQAMVEELESEIEAEEGKLDSMKRDLEEKEDTMAETKHTMEELSTETDKTETTLKLTKGNLKDLQDGLNKAGGKRDQAKSMLTLTEKDLQRKIEAASVLHSKLAAATQQVAVEKEALSAGNEDLKKRQEAHTQAEFALERKKPDIVRLHGLGLFQLLGD